MSTLNVYSAPPFLYTFSSSEAYVTEKGLSDTSSPLDPDKIFEYTTQGSTLSSTLVFYSASQPSSVVQLMVLDQNNVIIPGSEAQTGVGPVTRSTYTFSNSIPQGQKLRFKLRVSNITKLQSPLINISVAFNN